MKKSSKRIFIFVLLLSLSICSVNQETPNVSTQPLKATDGATEIMINIDSDHNFGRIYLGDNGTLFFVTDYNGSDPIFYDSDFNENFSFDTSIQFDSKDEFNAICRFWKPLNENLVILCKLSKNLVNELHRITLFQKTLFYKDYNISIVYSASISVQQLENPLPFLYSEKQTINIEQDKVIYELKFKLGDYHNENLLLHGTGFN